MRRVSDRERRARLGLRHMLARPAGTVEEAAEALVGLHASDPVSVYLAARARVTGLTREHLQTALYERRTLVRMLGMRRTLFVLSPDTAAIVDAACTRALAPPQRRRLVRVLEEQSITDDGEAWIDRVSAAVLAALHERGEASAAELTADVPEMGLKIVFGEGREWGGEFGMSTRILFLLATEGHIVRGRPRGTWVSSLYRWAPTDRWLGRELVTVETSVARAELVRRWLAAFGPGTFTDLKWWTGWTVGATRQALEDSHSVEVELDEGMGYLRADDLEPVTEPDPWVAFLPSLDPTAMGWKERDWYFGEHAAMLFDRNGNAGPTVWCDGRVVGGWAQHPGGEVVFELLEDIGAEKSEAVAAEAARLAAWFGDDVITPRFRTPLERRLAT